MSYGNTEKAEPNMTPLLDLVLQLVMFFMLCANFVMEQTSIEVKLPKAIAAKALDREDSDLIFLNVAMVKELDENNVEREVPRVFLPLTEREGQTDRLDNEVQVQNHMMRRAEREKRQTGNDKPHGVVVLRVDKLIPFEATYSFMRACRTAGYEKVQLRAERSTED